MESSATCYGEPGVAEVIRLYHLFSPPDNLEDVHAALPFSTGATVKTAIAELRLRGELIPRDDPPAAFKLSDDARDALAARFTDPGYCRAWLERLEAEQTEATGTESASCLQLLRDEVHNEAEASNIDPYPEVTAAMEAAARAAQRVACTGEPPSMLELLGKLPEQKWVRERRERVHVVDTSTIATQVLDEANNPEPSVTQLIPKGFPKRRKRLSFVS
jgi:hypothetical protein